MKTLTKAKARRRGGVVYAVDTLLLYQITSDLKIQDMRQPLWTYPWHPGEGLHAVVVSFAGPVAVVL